MKIEDLVQEGIYLFSDGEKYRFSHIGVKGYPVWYLNKEYSFQDCFIDRNWQDNIVKFLEMDGLIAGKDFVYGKD